MSKIYAISISALLFALSHFINSNIDAGSFISSILIGVICGYCYLSTGSSLSAMLPHLTNNIIWIGYILILCGQRP
ncbi:MAG: CPBP family intramembrane metalloprotease [Desulfobacteraceae bacterium]|nr:CPBP family intramembrane metalloprotease [Desulfobacteraceae bacterium]